MKKKWIILLLGLMCSTSILAQNGDDKATLLEQFSDNLRRFITTVDGLSEAQWNYHEEEGRWSIAEVAEHIVLSEDLFFNTILDQVLKTTPQPELKKDSSQMDRMISAGVRDRSQKFQAPDAVRPKSMFKTSEEAIFALIKARSKTIDFIESDELDLRAYFMDHPLGMKLDAQQWFLFMVGHADRHMKQLKQVKDHAGYPPAID